MNLIKQLKVDMITAMKSKETEKLSTLRLLIAEMEKEKVSFKLQTVEDLTNKQVHVVINRTLKKLDKEIEAYINVGKNTLKQTTEKYLLLSYLPEQLTSDEIRPFVIKALELTNNGQIKNPMQYLSKELKGKADMSIVSKIVKELA